MPEPEEEDQTTPVPPGTVIGLITVTASGVVGQGTAPDEGEQK